jgi:hypothetical protein
MGLFSSILAIGALAAGFMASKKSQPKPIAPPPPEPPIAQGEVGEAQVTQARRKIKAGRGGDIFAGPLRPQNVGKQVLGGGG